jgi:hypothetical protein
LIISFAILMLLSSSVMEEQHFAPCGLLQTKANGGVEDPITSKLFVSGCFY